MFVEKGALANCPPGLRSNDVEGERPMRLELEQDTAGTVRLVVKAPMSELEPASRLAGALERLFASPEAAVGPQGPAEEPE